MKNKPNNKGEGSSKKTQGAGKVGSFGTHPFFVKKKAAAIAFLNQAGLPDAFADGASYTRFDS